MAGKFYLSRESGPRQTREPLPRATGGSGRFAAGVSATNADLASMNYYVEGIKADLPK